MTPARRPNVIYVTTDDLGTFLGAYGNAQVHSPNIDAFAARASLFERCYCQIAICSSSRTSIMTGVRPETSKLIALQHDWQATLPGARSLPGVFRDNGYRTASVGKVFDTRGGGPDDCWDLGGEQGGVVDAELAVERLDELAAGDAPFFLAVGFAQPHCPWVPTAESMARYDPATIELLGPGRAFDPDLQVCAEASALTVSDDEAREITARYYATVTDVDRAFGELLAAVERLGILDDTIILFWSGDHGFHLGQADFWGKWTCYDASTRIPLVMRVPGRGAPGARVTGIVEAVDMFPTLLELCHLPAPPQALDGLSFAPLFDDPGRPWKKAAFSVFGLGDVGQRAVKTPEHDFVIIEGTFFRPRTKHLFDLVADPQETTDLWSRDSPVAVELEAMLKAGPAAALPDP